MKLKCIKGYMDFQTGNYYFLVPDSFPSIPSYAVLVRDDTGYVARLVWQGDNIWFWGDGCAVFEEIH